MHSLRESWDRGRAFLGSEYPIMAGAMSWISESRLVSAVSEAGAFGVIACSAMSPTELLDEIVKSKSLVVGKPFGVNIILMHPQLDELIEICIKEKVTHVILAGGMPSKDNILRLKSADIKTIGFAPSMLVAKKLCRMGVDGIVVEGCEAGGHISRVSTSVLAQEILPEIREVPVFVAGGIGTSGMVKGYLDMGASGCQVGTLFACCKESIAHPRFKEKCIRSSSRDTVVSIQLDPAFNVIPVRSIKNDATQEFLLFQRKVIDEYNAGEFSKEDAQLKIEKFWAGSLKKAVIEGDVDRGSVMAGEVVGLVKEELSAKEIVQNLICCMEQYI